MLELFKSVMANPLQGIVAVLCVVVLSTSMGLTDMKVAQASMQEKQVTNERVNELVYRMNDTLVRVDENLIHIKDNVNLVMKNQQETFILLGAAK